MKKKPASEARPAAKDPGQTFGTRERIVRSASRLMQRQGYDGTGIKQIAQEAEATLGSVYHFFPGGKQELAVAAIAHANGEFVADLKAVLDGEADPARAVTAFSKHLAEELRASDWTAGCPITTTALGAAGRLPDVQVAASEAFARQRELVSAKLSDCGFGAQEARELAHMVINTLEGAEIAAQVARSDDPLEIAGRHLARMITAHRA
ncbi:TetR/AcrR family transcriptional regulator [Streptomyces sp. ISL-99]|uniref:TetR/AcrR family transcriptional regulator n=1 Tax=Streptomyces sp. ISL-99 TaxID=2819193 RepID=UPI0027E41EE5|nr:TetR/AcrR family transcriptional regulator [Streptomyces sp. ISL-99]